MFKNLIFDFDGVIVDSEILAAKAFIGVLSQMNIEHEYSSSIIAEKFAGKKMVKVAAEICETHKIIDAKSYLNNVMKLVSKSYRNNLKPVDGIKDLLINNSADLYISSNSDKQRILKGLNQVGLDTFFREDSIYTFEMVDNSKPSPDIYIKTIEDNNLNREKTLVFEDSVPGVKAAISAGLRVVGVTVASHWKGRSPKPLIEAGTSAILQSYIEFDNLLNSLQ